MILPLGERTGAETEATPCSRSPTDCAQPRRRMPDSAAAENAAFWRPRCMRSGSSHASSTWAAEPARMVSCEPTGIVSRRPEGRSAAATQTRMSPWRRHSCADSPVMSRSRASTGPAVASSRSSPAAADSSASRGPRTNRPCMSRATRRWCSSATASRCAVGRARPVPATRPARVAGPASRAVSTSAALSRTPTPDPPLELSILQYCRLRSWDARPTLDAVEWNGSRGSGHGQDADREGLGRARRTVGTRRTRPPLHRPAPHPRGHQPAGVRGAAAQRPDRPPPRPDHRDRGPQRPDPRLGQADPGPRLPHPGRDAAQERRGVRRPAAPARRPRPGHRPRRRPAARPHPAGHDDRLR